MFKKPEEARTTREESEKYGREINARSAQYENVEFEINEPQSTANKIPDPLSVEEIKQRVGEQYFKNMTDDKTVNSINEGF